jgi:hypothetical protein
MMLSRARREPYRSRLIIVTGAVVFVALAALSTWARPRHDWWNDAAFGLLIWAVVGVVVVAAVFGLASLRGRPRRLVMTGTSFAPEPAIPPGLLGLIWMCIAAQQADTASRLWTSTEPGRYADYGFIVVASVMVGLICALGIAALVWAWRGFVVELTPEGVIQRMPLFRRTIPWEALAPGGPAELPPPNKRVYLVSSRPELVTQRGLPLMQGERERPILTVDRHGWLVARAIRHYVEHPADRAAIGTPAGYDRLQAALAIAPPASPLPTVPAYGTVAPYVPTLPVRPRLIRVAAILVYVGVGLAVLSAAADLIFTIVFRDRLLAAERAIAGYIPPPPDDADVSGSFSTDTVSFARGSAVAVLLLTVVLGVIAVVLARAVVRGSDRARIGLAVMSGVYAGLALCSAATPVLSLASEPAAGTFLNIWAGAGLLHSVAAAGVGTAVLILLLNTRAAVAGPQDAMARDAT